ncbi:hypothetical protein GCM10020220_071660 [Nonomuraea rubra]
MVVPRRSEQARHLRVEAPPVVVDEDECTELLRALLDGLAQIVFEFIRDMSRHHRLRRVTRVELAATEEKTVGALVAKSASGTNVEKARI